MPGKKSPDGINVDDFHVQGQRVTGSKATVSVRYKELATVDGDEVKRGRKNSIVTFNVERNDGAWKVVAPFVQPHVSLAAYESNVRRRMASADPEELKRLKTVLENLREPKK